MKKILLYTSMLFLLSCTKERLFSEDGKIQHFITLRYNHQQIQFPEYSIQKDLFCGDTIYSIVAGKDLLFSIPAKEMKGELQGGMNYWNQNYSEHITVYVKGYDGTTLQATFKGQQTEGVIR